MTGWRARWAARQVRRQLDAEAREARAGWDAEREASARAIRASLDDVQTRRAAARAYDSYLRETTTASTRLLAARGWNDAEEPAQQPGWLARAFPRLFGGPDGWFT